MNGGEIKKFKSFRKRIYDGDRFYVGTAEFVLDMLLEKSTAFARSCDIVPLTCETNGKRTAQALWIKAPDTDYAQLSFFDCLEGDKSAAETVKDRAKQLTLKNGLKRLVVGLNAHLSYGVGLLTRAESKNTFDTCYNKTYYADFFRDGTEEHTLTAYKSSFKDALAELKKRSIDTSSYGVRFADFKNFEAECEIMRGICDRTIGKTFLYSPTQKGHFYELMKDMKIIMCPHDLMFLVYDGKDVGFLFWHPDYNCAVKAGKQVSALSLALGCAFKKKKIDTVKLNSIGVESGHRGRGTLALLEAMAREIDGKYDYIETNFVWDNNIQSSLLNRSLLGGECRKFSVFEYRF